MFVLGMGRGKKQFSHIFVLGQLLFPNVWIGNGNEKQGSQLNLGKISLKSIRKKLGMGVFAHAFVTVPLIDLD